MEELRKFIDLGTAKMQDDNPLLKALWRGIGVHHSGLPLKYRQVVEILFRCGFLRVILATGDIQEIFTKIPGSAHVIDAGVSL